MPTLRFSRDKRGYENTYVVHAPRRRHKSRTRILYWFRTPPGVRVGRAPLDEDAIRLMEEHHPHIRFDWPQILRGDEEVSGPPAGGGGREPRREIVPPPAAIEAVQVAPPETFVPVEEPVSPAHARLGSEGLARLRARYADVLAGISRRVADEARREQLKAEAERLNPDTWVTEAEVTTGLEQYESVLASLRNVIGRRRRRRKSRTGGAGSAPPGESSAAEGPDSTPEEPGEDDGDGPESEPVPGN